MDKLNLKNVLTAVRDMIMRNRVAYKDYLGSETVTKTNIIVEGILVEEGTLTLKDSSVTSFVIGESYDVTIDGVTEVMIAYDLSENSTGYRAPATNYNIIALGNVTDLSNLPSDGWVVAIDDGTAVCKTLGSYIGKSISISQTKTITEKYYDIKKLPDELLPNTVAKKTDVTAVKKLATNAQTLAETAQATANEAQATANEAQTTADAAQATANTANTTANTANKTANDAKTAAENAQTTANAAATKENPVFTGTFSQNRKVSSGIGNYSHAEGNKTTASGMASHAEGYDTTAGGNYSHAEGIHTTASGDFSHAEGYDTTASGRASHAEGDNATASGAYSHAEGNNTTASGAHSHAEGDNATASGAYSHAEGNNTTASGYYSHVEGSSSNAIPDTITSSSSNSDIISAWKTTRFSLAKGISSHVEGSDNLALGDYSHAEGDNATASGRASHAEGNNTTASGRASHAEGDNATASGDYSHAEGYCTKACSSYQHVQGKYNIEDSSNTYAHIVGNGDSDNALSNAHTLDWSGNAWFAGDVYTGSTSGTNKDEGSKKLATEEYVNGRITEDSIIIKSSTPDSTKKFKITVDDSGTISATEVT